MVVDDIEVWGGLDVFFVVVVFNFFFNLSFGEVGMFCCLIFCFFLCVVFFVFLFCNFECCFSCCRVIMVCYVFSFCIWVGECCFFCVFNKCFFWYVMCFVCVMNKNYVIRLKNIKFVKIELWVVLVLLLFKMIFFIYFFL